MSLERPYVYASGTKASTEYEKKRAKADEENRKFVREDAERGERSSAGLKVARERFVPWWISYVVGFFALAGYTIIGIQGVVWTGATFIVYIAAKRIGSIGKAKKFRIVMHRTKVNGKWRWSPKPKGEAE